MGVGTEVTEAPVETPAEEPAPAVTPEEAPAGEPPSEEPSEEAPPPPEQALAQQIADLKEQITELRTEKATPQRSEAEIRADLQESMRLQQQAETEQRQAEAAWKEELNESLQAVMATKGLYDVPAEDVRAVSERFINKRYDQIATREVGEVTTALRYLRENALGEPKTVNLTPKAARYANDLADSFNAIYGKLRQQALASGDLVPKAELETRVQQAVEADRAARGARAREDQDELARAPGKAAKTNVELTVEAAKTLSIAELRALRGK